MESIKDNYGVPIAPLAKLSIDIVTLCASLTRHIKVLQLETLQPQRVNTLNVLASHTENCYNIPTISICKDMTKGKAYGFVLQKAVFILLLPTRQVFNIYYTLVDLLLN